MTTVGCAVKYDFAVAPSVIAGFLAKGYIISKKHSIRSAIVSFVLVFILSTIVLDTCSVFYYMTNVGAESVIAIYIAGIPVNISNSLASALCVFLLLKPISAMLDRIKIKYGVEY